MPNHVYNRIEFQGDKEEIEKLFKKAQIKDSNGEESIFTFNAFVPMPEKVFRGSLGSEDKKQYPGTKNWYNWSIKYWGTKWDCYDITIYKSILEFGTAWSPPFPIIKAISKQFPKLKIFYSYEEPLMELEGNLILKAGRQIRA